MSTASPPPETAEAPGPGGQTGPYRFQRAGYGQSLGPPGASYYSTPDAGSEGDQRAREIAAEWTRTADVDLALPLEAVRAQLERLAERLEAEDDSPPASPPPPRYFWGPF